MTAPRQILPGTTYLVTRRCARREFLLRPSDETNGILSYVLALAAGRHGVKVHAFCAMSNHLHLVVTDPEAALPRFMQYLCSLVARALNASREEWEWFWAPGSYSAVELVSLDDVVDKVSYVLANPVAAGLVKHAQEWPGAWTAPASIGSTSTVKRPETFFRRDGYLPASVELELAVPRGFASACEFRARVTAALADREKVAHRDARAAGRGFLGAKAVLTQDPKSRPASAEPRRGMKPRVAARDTRDRVEALLRIASFVDGYRQALRAWRAGFHAVLFPAGTYLMRVAHGARCAA